MDELVEGIYVIEGLERKNKRVESWGPQLRFKPAISEYAGRGAMYMLKSVEAYEYLISMILRTLLLRQRQRRRKD